MFAIKINFVNYSAIIFPQTYEINIVLIFIENFRIIRIINAIEEKKKSLITRTITIHVFYVSYGTI